MSLCNKQHLRKRAIRPKYDLWTLRKNDSSTLRNVPPNTSEHTCDYLRYMSLLICLRWSVIWFWKKAPHRKTLVMESLYACNFIKKWLQHRCFPVNFAKLSRTSTLCNICEQMFYFWVINNFDVRRFYHFLAE